MLRVKKVVSQLKQILTVRAQGPDPKNNLVPEMEQSI